MYNHEHHLGGTVISEYQLEELRQEREQAQRAPRTQSIIRKPYVGSNPSGRIPVAHPRVSPNNVRQYEPIKPYFRPHKSYLGRRKKK